MQGIQEFEGSAHHQRVSPQGHKRAHVHVHVVPAESLEICSRSPLWHQNKENIRGWECPKQLSWVSAQNEDFSKIHWAGADNTARCKICGCSSFFYWELFFWALKIWGDAGQWKEGKIFGLTGEKKFNFVTWKRAVR